MLHFTLVVEAALNVPMFVMAQKEFNKFYFLWKNVT